jgi:hypothetical protein
MKSRLIFPIQGRQTSKGHRTAPPPSTAYTLGVAEPMSMFQGLERALAIWSFRSHTYRKTEDLVHPLLKVLELCYISRFLNDQAQSTYS